MLGGDATQSAQLEGVYGTLLQLLRKQVELGHTLVPSTNGGRAHHQPPSAKHRSNAKNDEDDGALTQDQLRQLRAQVVAYRYLAKNVQIPIPLLNSLREYSEVPAEAPPAHAPGGIAPLGTAYPGSAPLSMQHVADNGKPLVLPIFTQQKPVDPVFSFTSLKAAREERIALRLRERQQELARLAAVKDAPSSEEELIRLKLELKQLQLLPLQKQIRAAVVQRLRRLIELEVANDEFGFRRQQRKARELQHHPQNQQLLVPGGLQTKYGSSSIVDMYGKTADINALRPRHSEFIGAVLRHCKDFKEFHLQRQKRIKRTNKEILAYHSNEARRQQIEKERK